MKRLGIRKQEVGPLNAATTIERLTLNAEITENFSTYIFHNRLESN